MVQQLAAGLNQIISASTAFHSSDKIGHPFDVPGGDIEDTGYACFGSQNEPKWLELRQLAQFHA